MPITVSSVKPWCLVVRLGAIGDNLIASSVLPLLSREYNVEVLCQRPHHVVFENNPYVSKLSIRDPGDIPHETSLQWHDWFKDRGKEYAKWINLSHSCESILALFPGQTQFYWPASWRRANCGKNYLEAVHDICEVPYDFTVGPRFYPTDEEKAKAVDTLTKVRSGGRTHVVGMPLAGSRVDKVWPHATMLAAKLIREAGCAVVVFGTPDKELELAKRIENFVGLHNGSVDGLHTAITATSGTPLADWSVRRAAATLQQCDVVVGPDTGMMWAVAMEDTAKVMLLSHASPENITKHWVNTTTLHATQSKVPCWPCHQLHDSPDTCRKAAMHDAAACIADISDDAVLTAVVKALKGDTCHGRDRCVRGKNFVGLAAHDQFADEAGGLVDRFIAGRPIVDFGFGDSDRFRDNASTAADGVRVVPCG